MLDDIRNSSLLIMISAVAMAVVAIVAQPEPPQHAAPAQHQTAAAPARAVMTARASPTAPPACGTARPPTFAAATQARNEP